MKNANQSFQETCKNILHIDTSDIMTELEQKIDESISLGLFAAYSKPYDNIQKLEKAALELNDLGYNCAVHYSGDRILVDGIHKPLAYIQLNWKFIPANIRESYVKL